MKIPESHGPWPSGVGRSEVWKRAHGPCTCFDSRQVSAFDARPHAPRCRDSNCARARLRSLTSPGPWGRALPLAPADATAPNRETSKKFLSICEVCDCVQRWLRFGPGASGRGGQQAQGGKTGGPSRHSTAISCHRGATSEPLCTCKMTAPRLALHGSEVPMEFIGPASHRPDFASFLRVHRRYCFFNIRSAACVAGIRVPDEAVLGLNKDSRVLVQIRSWFASTALAASVIMRASQNITAWASRLPGWLSRCR